MAWKGLTGEIGKEEIVYELRMIGSRKGVVAMREKNSYLMENDPEFAIKVRENVKRIQPEAVIAALSVESRKKRIDSFSRIGHQKGEKNSQYGTMWVTNGRENKKINREDAMPEGFKRGRTLPSTGHNLQPNRLNVMRENAQCLNSQKWMCLETGYVSTAGGLHSYQRKRGIDTNKRTRVS